MCKALGAWCPGVDDVVSRDVVSRARARGRAISMLSLRVVRWGVQGGLPPARKIAFQLPKTKSVMRLSPPRRGAAGGVDV
jgi:hypothetical protein